MDLSDACSLCLSLPGAEETTPFGPDALVFKTGGKMFALTVPDDFPPRLNLKCDPVRAVELREAYEGITPGYHMNKQHWNTVLLDGSVPSALVRELILHSHALVVKSLSSAMRRQLNGGGGKDSGKNP